MILICNGYDVHLASLSLNAARATRLDFIPQSHISYWECEGTGDVSGIEACMHAECDVCLHNACVDVCICTVCYRWGCSLRVWVEHDIYTSRRRLVSLDLA